MPFPCRSHPARRLALVGRHVLLGVLLVVGVACRTDADTETPPASELIVRPSPVVLRAGETVQLTAQVNDTHGRPIGGANVTFHADSTAIVRVTPTGTVSAVGVTGRDSLTISTAGVARVVPVTVHAGPANLLEVTSGAAQAGLAGSGLADPIVVTVRDAFGNVVPRTPVRLTAESGGKVEPTTVTTDERGTARAMWTLGPLAGPQTLLVRADSTSSIVEATAFAGAMARVEQVGTFPRRTHAADTVRLRLRAVDRFGNGVVSTVFAFSVADGGGIVTPSRLESDSSGIVAVDWRMGEGAGLNTLRVRVFETRDTTLTVSVRTIGGPPARVALVSGANQRAAPGAAVPRAPTLRVVDRHGNPVAAARVRLVAQGGGSVEPSEVVTDDRGLAAPRRWILGDASDQALLAMADGVADTLRISARATKR